MEKIKEGYKQTEVGVIPVDWEVSSLRDVGEVKMCKRIMKNQTSDKGDIPFYKIGTFGDVADAYITKELYTKYREMYSFPKYGDILISAAGTIGRTVVYDGTPSYYQDSNIVWIDNNEKFIINKLLYYLYDDIDWDLSQGTIPRLYNDNLKSAIIVFPSTKIEQHAIASALSDIDALISSLNKKIEKKKAIKQGLMQQLLTGKKRLPGFSGEWVEKTIFELADSNKSNFDDGDWIESQYLSKDGMRLIQTGNIGIGKFKDNNHKYISNETFESLHCKEVKPGDILICRLAEPAGRSCITPNLNVRMITSVDVTIFRPIDVYDSYFILQQINLPSWFDKINEKCGGSTRTRIARSEMAKIPILVPPTKIEQKAIADIFLNIDKDISETEASRNKYIQIKAAMMQQLLTGKIRLVEPVQENLCTKAIAVIPIDAHIIGGHIVRRLYASNGWGRTKFQKALHLIGYCCQLDLGNGYIRNTAGPDDERLMNYIDSKFKQYHQVEIEKETYKNGYPHYNYKPTKQIAEIEQAFDSYPVDLRNKINSLLDKIGSMDLGRAEIVSTLYAVWNNRIIKKQEINDHVILSDFYAWSKHKSDFSKDLVLKALNYMRNNDIVPIGWGKYIDKNNMFMDSHIGEIEWKTC